MWTSFSPDSTVRSPARQWWLKQEALTSKRSVSRGSSRHGDLFVDGEYPIKKIKKVMIEGTPAENKNHTREECVGFIMTVDGITLYGAGDTNYYPEMESFNDLDYALLPVDGIYNMSAQEASRCAHVIDSRYFIPIHTSPTQLYDEDIAKSFKSPHALYIKPGERLKL